MLTLLTATGCRPEAWAITEQLMLAQDYAGPVRWVIVDDGETPQPITFEREGWTLEVIRPAPFWRAGQNTQARNLCAGLAVIKDDERVLIIEDDDHVKPTYLRAMNAMLDKADLVGESFARYYNVKTRHYRQLSNAMHASLCSTAVKGGAIESLRRECKPGVQFIDLNLWRNFNGSKLLQRNGLVTGIKGMSGRGGIGMGHRADFTGSLDVTGSVLRQWVGSDASRYQGQP